MRLLFDRGEAMARGTGTDLGVTSLGQFVLLPPPVLLWALPLCWKGQRENEEANEHIEPENLLAHPDSA